MSDVGSLVGLLRVEVSGLAFGLELDAVAGVRRADSCRFGGARDGSVARLTFAGEEIPVYALGALLGTGSSVAGARYVAVCGGRGGRTRARLGLLVDRVRERVEIPRERLQPFPPAAEPETALFASIGVLGEELLPILEPGSVAGGTPPRATAAPGRVRPPRPRDGAAFGDGRAGRIAVFRIALPREGTAAEALALSLTQVAEVLRPSPTLGVPGAPAHVIGLLSWRGRPVPLLDLARRLGRTGAPVPHRAERFLVARGAAPGALVAWPVHEDVDVRALPLAHRPIAYEGPFVRAAFETASERLLVPDVDALAAPAAAPVDLAS